MSVSPSAAIVMADFAIGLGSNLGGREASLSAAIDRYCEGDNVTLLALSSLWETPPWGVTDQPGFLNACMRIRSELGPLDLLDRALKTEEELGRVRGAKWGPRLIDIDLLLSDQLTWKDERLCLPHPHIAERPFVLIPLAEICPDWRLQDQSIQMLADQCDQTGMVQVKRRWHD